MQHFRSLVSAISKEVLDTDNWINIGKENGWMSNYSDSKQMAMLEDVWRKAPLRISKQHWKNIIQVNEYIKDYELGQFNLITNTKELNIPQKPHCDY